MIKLWFIWLCWAWYLTKTKLSHIATTSTVNLYLNKRYNYILNDNNVISQYLKILYICINRFIVWIYLELLWHTSGAHFASIRSSYWWVVTSSSCSKRSVTTMMTVLIDRYCRYTITIVFSLHFKTRTASFPMPEIRV